MGYIVLGFLFGIICAIVAGSKHRNPIGWFFVGFLIPLVGLILVIALPPGEGGLQVPTDMPMPPPQAVPDSPAVALEKLAALRDSGVVTEVEFQTKKQELLARL